MVRESIQNLCTVLANTSLTLHNLICILLLSSITIYKLASPVYGTDINCNVDIFDVVTINSNIMTLTVGCCFCSCVRRKDAKLVLSVLKDEKDKSLLRFVDVGPIYASPDYEVGIDDAIKFFPHDYDEMDGEVKIWLAQQSARDEEAAAVGDGDGDGDENGDGGGCASAEGEESPVKGDGEDAGEEADGSQPQQKDQQQPSTPAPAAPEIG